MQKGLIYFVTTGEVKNAQQYLNNISDEELFKNFKRDCANKKVLCNLCKERLFVKKRTDTNLRFMSHHANKNSKKQKCDNFDTATRDKFGARSSIYYGEGSLHEKLINFVTNMLYKEDIFSNPKAETYLFSKIEKYENGIRKRKKPDIQVDYLNTKVALEVQLSYQLDIDFLERETFYLNNKMFLIWFFYDIKKDNFKESDKMIFWNNNENCYVITAETIRLSKEKNKLHFWCYYNEYISRNNKIIALPKQNIITFSDLTYNNKQQRIYYKNVTVEKIKLKLITYFKDTDNTILNEEIKKDINNLINHYPLQELKFTRVLKTLFSLKENKPIGYKFPNLFAILNNFFEHTRGYENLILKAIQVYNRGEDLKNHINFKDSLEKKIRDREKEQNNDLNEIIYILFPELFRKEAP